LVFVVKTKNFRDLASSVKNDLLGNTNNESKIQKYYII
jgi:hypothetical protein